MNVKSFISYIPLTTIASSAVTTSYAPINAGGTTEPCFAFKIVNNSTQDITVSLNGTTDHDYIPTLTAALYDIQTNSQPGNQVSLLRKGQVVYVKGTAGTGNIYLVGLMNPSSNPAGL